MTGDIDLTLFEQLAEAERSMIALAVEFQASADTHIIGMGEGLAVAAAELRRIRSLVAA